MAELAILGGKKTVQLPTYEWPVEFLKRHGQREADGVANVIKRGLVWGTFAPEISAFESEFAQYIGVKYAIFMNSGTAAIWCARPIYMQPVFQTREGWGKGFPWKSPYVTRDITYPKGLCPVAERISNETFNLSLHPPNGLPLMEEYAQAFEKVIEHIDELDQVKVPPWEEWWGGYVPAFGKEKQESKMEEISGYR